MFQFKVARVSVLLLLCGLFAGAPATAQDRKANDAGKLAARVGLELEKLYKAWDKNKDGMASEAELDKYYARLKPKKKADENAIDMFAPVTALLKSLDANKNDAIDKAEFDEWAPKFAGYWAEFAQVHDELTKAQRELAAIEVQLARSRGVTAGDGIAADIFQRNAIRWKAQVEELEAKAAKLGEEGGHGAYQEFLYRELAPRMKR